MSFLSLRSQRLPCTPGSNALCCIEVLPLLVNLHAHVHAARRAPTLHFWEPMRPVGCARARITDSNMPLSLKQACACHTILCCASEPLPSCTSALLMNLP